MIFVLDELLPKAEVASLRAALERATFVDGSPTAGAWNREQKRNKQLALDQAHALGPRIIDRLIANRSFCDVAFPVQFVTPTFNRYDAGDYYAPHEDSPLQSGIRADISYTLFLSEPGDYAGGELVLSPGSTERRFREPAGTLVLYPSGTPHQVLPVEHGTRFAAVGWVQSALRDASERELLVRFRGGLDAAFERWGPGAEFSRLSSVYSALLRLWVNP